MSGESWGGRNMGLGSLSLSLLSSLPLFKAVGGTSVAVIGVTPPKEKRKKIKKKLAVGD